MASPAQGQFWAANAYEKHGDYDQFFAQANQQLQEEFYSQESVDYDYPTCILDIMAVVIKKNKNRMMVNIGINELPMIIETSQWLRLLMSSRTKMM